MKKTTLNFYLDGCSSNPDVIEDAKKELKTLRGKERENFLQSFNKPRSVFAYVRVPGLPKPIKCYTGWKCPQQNWEGDNVSQKADATLCKKISELVEWFTDVTRERSTVVITKELFENKIDAINGEKERNKLLSDFVPWVEKYIKDYNGAETTRKSYSTTLKHLKNYAEKKKIKLSWEIFNMDFYHGFMEYLYKCGLVDSTTGKIIEHVKIFLGKAFEADKHENINFKKKSFKILTTDSDSIALSEEEIEKIYKLDLSDIPEYHRQLLTAAKLLFVLNCWIGLRVSDLFKLRKHHIKESEAGKFISITTRKTTADVVIPLNQIAAEILEQHGEWLFDVVFQPRDYNDRLKELGEKAGFKEMVQDRVTVRGITTERFVHKYKKMSAHVARRSFATNCYRMQIPIESIMSVTGHRTEKNFRKYLKISAQEHAIKMMEHFKKAQPVMKVA